MNDEEHHCVIDIYSRVQLPGVGIVAWVHAPWVTWTGVLLTRWVARVRWTRLGVEVRVRHGLLVSLWGRRRSRIMTGPGL